MIAALFFTLTWIVPALFFVGILARTFRRRPEIAGNLSSGPFVLLFFGLWFFAVNGPLMGLFIRAMEYRLGTGIAGYLTHRELDALRVAFGLGALSVIATLAKALWTHTLLEENVWGSISNYREPLWKRGKFFGWLEYGLRCFIAVQIALMQNSLSDVSNVPFIQEVYNNKTLPQTRESEFMLNFSAWLGEFTRFGFWLYLSIMAWTALVFMSPGDRREFRKALAGTLTSTVPAWLLVWFVYVLSTGDYTPFPFEVIRAGEPPKLLIVSSLVTFFVLFLCIACNLFYTIWKGPLDEITQLIKLRRSGGGTDNHDPGPP